MHTMKVERHASKNGVIIIKMPRHATKENLQNSNKQRTKWFAEGGASLQRANSFLLKDGTPVTFHFVQQCAILEGLNMTGGKQMMKFNATMLTSGVQKVE